MTRDRDRLKLPPPWAIAVANFCVGTVFCSAANGVNFCTRKPNHRGDHVAVTQLRRGLGVRVVAIWRDR